MLVVIKKGMQGREGEGQIVGAKEHKRNTKKRIHRLVACVLMNGLLNNCGIIMQTAGLITQR